MLGLSNESFLPTVIYCEDCEDYHYSDECPLLDLQAGYAGDENEGEPDTTTR